MKCSKFQSPEDSPGYMLWRLSTTWRRAIEAVLKPLNITHPQFVVLASTAWLTRNGEKVSQAAIGRQSELDPNTISQILGALQRKGWIERVRILDERSKNASLTPLGHSVLDQALLLVEQADSAFFSQDDTRRGLKVFKKYTL